MMTQEDLLRAAPATFAEHPIDDVSKKYSFIPTTQLLEDLKDHNWHVDRARQQKSKHRDFTKHMLILRSPDFPMINGYHPELIMVNSHDRTASFNFMIGLFKTACLNGLIVADTVFESFRIRHIHYEFSDVKELAKAIEDGMPAIIENVNKFQNTIMTPSQQREFALKALATRFKEYVAEDGTVKIKALEKAVDVEEFLRPQREEDDNPTVWAVYNRVQEKLMNGGFKRMGTKDERWKSVRKITNIKLDVDMNKALWQLANEYLPN